MKNKENYLTQRRSVKSYKKEQITKEELDAVLEAGLYAPSGMNRQPTIMVAVTDADTIKNLSRMNAAVMGSNSDPFYGAPAVIVVFSDSTVPTYFEDGCLVMGNLLNGAHLEGLASCWIHRAREVFSSDEGKELMKKWGVPDTYVGIGNCILGYPLGETPAVRERRSGRIIKI